MGTSLVSDGSANAEPATPTELIASTLFDTDWVNIWFHTNASSNTDSDSLVNIKVGAGGSEVDLIPNLLAGWANSLANNSGMRRYSFPLRIPAGSRLSGTHRSQRTAQGVRCLIELLGSDRAGHWTGTGVEAVGANTSVSSGTYVTPGTTSEGTLTSLGTTTQEWGFVQPMLGGNTDTTMNAGVLAIDLGSSNSVVIPGLDDFFFWTSGNEYSANDSMGRFCYVPVGTTLHARGQFSGTAEAMAYVCYGVF